MSGGKAAAYAERIVARARELYEQDAFAPARTSAPAVPAAQAKALVRADRRASRRMVVVFTCVSLIIAAFSLLLPYYGFNTMGAGGTVLAPGEVLDCYRLWFDLNVAPLLDGSLTSRTASVVAAFQETHADGLYNLVMDRVAVTVVVVACGMMLALSGLLFQTSFRNPLAAPSSLGISDGVTLGCIVFSMMGYTAITDSPLLYVQLVYGLGALAVVAVLALSRLLSGGARYNVLDMLLLGTVVCQLLGGVNGYIQNFIMDETAWYNFYDIQQAADALASPLIRRVLLAVFLVTFVPALVLRFKLNLISFGDDDGRMMGVRAGMLRAGALVLGSIMQLAAIASIGPVAMLSLAVPFLVRYALPADFAHQFLGNCLVGCTVLLACIAIQHFAIVGILTVPVGTIVSVFIIPFFVWMVAFGRGGW